MLLFKTLRIPEMLQLKINKCLRLPSTITNDPIFHKVYNTNQPIICYIKSRNIKDLLISEKFTPNTPMIALEPTLPTPTLTSVTSQPITFNEPPVEPTNPLLSVVHIIPSTSIFLPSRRPINHSNSSTNAAAISLTSAAASSPPSAAETSSFSHPLLSSTLPLYHQLCNSFQAVPSLRPQSTSSFAIPQ